MEPDNSNSTQKNPQQSKKKSYIKNIFNYKCGKFDDVHSSSTSAVVTLTHTPPQNPTEDTSKSLVVNTSPEYKDIHPIESSIKYYTSKSSEQEGDIFLHTSPGQYSSSELISSPDQYSSEEGDVYFYSQRLLSVPPERTIYSPPPYYRR